MPSVLIANIAEMRGHVPAVDYTDAALAQIVAANDAEIIRVTGPHDGERVLTLEVDPGQVAIYLRWPADSITSITQDDPAVTVEESGYRVIRNGYALLKTAGWQPPVVITYEPTERNAQRLMALVQLTRLDVQDTGLKSYGDGSYREVSADIKTQKAEILMGLQGPVIV